MKKGSETAPSPAVSARLQHVRSAVASYFVVTEVSKEVDDYDAEKEGANICHIVALCKAENESGPIDSVEREQQPEPALPKRNG